MNNTTDALRTIMEDKDLPARVSNRMLLAMLMDISENLDGVIKQNQADHKCFQETTKNQGDYPSMTWLFAHKPVKTIGSVLLIFVVLMALYTAGILKLFGLAVGVNLP